jgi:hypothetical protein
VAIWRLKFGEGGDGLLSSSCSSISLIKRLVKPELLEPPEEYGDVLS